MDAWAVKQNPPVTRNEAMLQILSKDRGRSHPRRRRGNEMMATDQPDSPLAGLSLDIAIHLRWGPAASCHSVPTQIKELRSKIDSSSERCAPVCFTDSSRSNPRTRRFRATTASVSCTEAVFFKRPDARRCRTTHVGPNQKVRCRLRDWPNRS
jgi:hypothetical protein